MNTALEISDSMACPKNNHLIELKEIVRLSLPIVIAQLSIIATGFIDTMMAGNYSNNALAGAAVGSSLCFPFIIALNGVMMAVTPITAHLTGAGRKGESGKVVRQALWLGLFVSALLFIGSRCIDPLLAIMQTTEEVIPIVKGYLTGISYGFPAIACYFVLKSYAEGIGKTKPQMVISLLTVPFNYFVNDILVYGRFGLPEMGGIGCGWASGLTFWLFFFLMLGYTILNKSCRKGGVFSEISFPSISGIVFSIPLSIGMALTIRSGHALGRKDPEAARCACITGCILAMCISLFTPALHKKLAINMK